MCTSVQASIWPLSKVIQNIFGFQTAIKGAIRGVGAGFQVLQEQLEFSTPINNRALPLPLAGTVLAVNQMVQQLFLLTKDKSSCIAHGFLRSANELFTLLPRLQAQGIEFIIATRDVAVIRKAVASSTR